MDAQGWLQADTTGIWEVPMLIEWQNVLAKAGDKIVGKNGKVDPALLLSFVESDFKVWQKEEMERKAQDSKMTEVLHQIFDEAETNQLDKKTVMTFAIAKLGVKIKYAADATAKIDKALTDYGNEAVFVTYKSGPFVYAIRLRDRDGKETGQKNPATMVKVAGGTVSGDVPKRLMDKPYARFISKVFDALNISRRDFDRVKRAKRQDNVTPQEVLDFLAAEKKAADKTGEEE